METFVEAYFLLDLHPRGACFEDLIAEERLCGGEAVVVVVFHPKEVQLQGVEDVAKFASVELGVLIADVLIVGCEIVEKLDPARKTLGADQDDVAVAIELLLFLARVPQLFRGVLVHVPYRCAAPFLSAALRLREELVHAPYPYVPSQELAVVVVAQSI